MIAYERVFVTSDTHGMARMDALIDWASQARDSDLLLHAGDSEILDPIHGGEPMAFFSSLPCDVALIDGNHDDYAALLAHPRERWCGGMAHRLGRNVRALERGEVYRVGEKSLFAFGGAMMEGYVPDLSLPPPGELPTAAEFERGLRNLQACGNRVDWILTHDAPTFAAGERACDPVRPFLQQIHDAVAFTRWIYGHHHRCAAPTPKLRCIFRQVMEFDAARR